MLVIPRLTVSEYIDLCRSSISSVTDFCRTVTDYLPDTPEFEDADSLDVFFLLLATRVHYINPTITFTVKENEKLVIDISEWFERAKDTIFNPTDYPRSKRIERGGVEVDIGAPKLSDTYEFSLWMAENTDLTHGEFEREINEDFLSTMCYIRRVKVGDQVFTDRDSIRLYLENMQQSVYSELRGEIRELSDDLSVVLCDVPTEDGFQPLILTPVNALETARSLFSENPQEIIRMAYYLGRHAHIEPFDMEPGHMEEMLEHLYEEMKSEAKKPGEMMTEGGDF